MSKYKPTVSDKYAKKLQDWQDNVYKETKDRKTQEVEFLGRKFSIPNNVHAINGMSDLLGNSVLREVKESDKVLDMGTGSGVNAILAATKSKDVTAIDVNPEAVRTAKENAKANSVDQRINFKVSDVFTGVDGKFDLIIFDPPFRWFKPRDVYEVSTTDEGYKALTRFFEEVENYLAEDGRMLICFGSSGDIDYLYKLIHEHGYKKEVVAHRDLEKEGIKVDYYTFLVKK